MGNSKPLELMESVIKVLEKAGSKAMEYYGRHGQVADKLDDSPVTQADLAANDVIISGLRGFGYPILSEEGAGDKNRLDADLVWIVDPLDGTKDFIQETGEFTLMAGMVEKRSGGFYRPVLGAIYRPVTDTVYCAAKGEGAWVSHDRQEPKELRVSPESEYRNLVMLTSRNHTTALERQLADKTGIAKIITYGSSLKACLIAEQAGHINLNPAPRTYEWDVCSSDIIIHEAGGKFTDSQGRIITYNKKDPTNRYGYLATNGQVHSSILAELKTLA